jgi:hypothetical protein
VGLTSEDSEVVDMALDLRRDDTAADLGSPMLVTRVTCHGDLVMIRLKPSSADAHPSGHGHPEAGVTVVCRLGPDCARDLACLDLWRSNHLVVRAALDLEVGCLSLWRLARGRRVVLGVERSRR